jgi:cellobiose phosphorylase
MALVVLIYKLLAGSITRAGIHRYRVEPYVACADVYSIPPHVGRGGWTWYTGSAGWMYRVALEAVLGVQLEAGERLRVRPCVPDDWTEYLVHYRMPDSRERYEIVVRNPDRSSATVRAVTVDGAPGHVIDGAAVVPLAKDDRQHRVEVVLGG